MNKNIILLCALVFWGTAPAVAETKEVKQLRKATDVLNEVMSAPEKGIPQDLLNRAVCVGIVPSEIRAAFIVGGTYGRGVLVCRKNGNDSWGAPCLFTLGGANVGFQIGGKTTDVVFIVMNGDGAKKLLQDKVKLGVDASAAAGPVGRTAEGATDVQMHAEILSYSRTRSLFAGVSLEGAVVKQDADDNEHLYGRQVDPKDILIKGTVSAPPAAQSLDRTLAKYSPHGGVAMAKT